MKKLLLTLTMFFAVNCIASNDSIYVDLTDMIPIELRVAIDNHTNIPRNPKAPIISPKVYISGYTLFINGNVDCVLLKDEDGVEVYSAIVADCTDTIQLPTYLSGEYELHIHRGNFCFWGEIEL